MAWTQQTFWAASAQVIPVLALALVIEARAVSRKWTLTRKGQRWTEAAILLVVAGALTLAMNTSFVALAAAEDLGRPYVLITASVINAAFTLLAFNAIIVVASRGFIDLRLSSRVPFTSGWHVRRFATRWRKTFVANLEEIEALLPSAIRARAQAVEAAANRPIREKDLEWFAEWVSVRNPSDENIPPELTELANAVEAYRERGTAARQRRVQQLVGRSAARMVASVRLQRLRVMDQIAELDQIATDPRRLDSTDGWEARIAAVIASAPEPTLIPASAGGG